jgi:uncharacterized protein (DUF433 family)
VLGTLSWRTSATEARQAEVTVQDISEIIPLETDTDGVLRVGKTRVMLDSLIGAFNNGASAEEIAQQYPSVPLADVYSVVAYYLRRREVVQAYLALS